MHNILTKEDLEALQKEYDYRNVTLRAEIAREKMEAAAHGDRSENAEYIAAKQRYYENNRRLAYLRKMIKTAKLVEDVGEDRCNIGDKILIEFVEDNEKAEITLTSTLKSDPTKWFIGVESPLGAAIYKRKVGDTVIVNSPQGDYSVKIHEIIKNK
ncbi:GreA/GreB family elongation factor [Clostridium thermopalmarium]|uniref:Transcription elongation factor GreA n=1 Tax=Clostridium thermopalmarium DSM 5974 TaxID=1121340 RepID=A0A2T0AK57_9CLOT|nr:GreA/GreB family elongation factor [Clostridium thermopalmarium]MBE6043579.1 transcription elongation factor GreA [Clostridium thermopalmarium]PRR68807.1 Transcription elongation factor GreA [Clostridium thermopalmarium DSM 5974]PVZ22611.1 transcription elongation factor GreA [Clostridium thermopalmarium DSM 5974]